MDDLKSKIIESAIRNITEMESVKGFSNVDLNFSYCPINILIVTSHDACLYPINEVICNGPLLITPGEDYYFTDIKSITIE
jgi:hypothetical protein